MTQAKWLASVIFLSGMLLMLTACNLSDAFRSQTAAPAPDTRVTLQAKGCSPDADISLMNKTQQIVQQRLIGLGVSNVQVEAQDVGHLTIDLPALKDPAQMLDVVLRAGRLEFVDAGKESYPGGAILRTTGNPTPTISVSNTLAATVPDKIYPVIITGADFRPDELKVVLGGVDSQQPQVAFKLEKTAAQKFAEFTTTHNATVLNQQYFLCIVLDNVVQSCPIVMSPITTGEGVITVGQGGIAEANRLLNLLRFGSLPYELEVIRTESK
jgi:preprotein translocase subunit SecD